MPFDCPPPPTPPSPITATYSVFTETEYGPSLMEFFEKVCKSMLTPPLIPISHSSTPETPKFENLPDPPEPIGMPEQGTRKLAHRPSPKRQRRNSIEFNSYRNFKENS